MTNKDPIALQKALDYIGMSGVLPTQQWRHAKTQSVYAIVCLSVDEVLLTPLVTYCSLERGLVWTRDLSVFLGLNEDGNQRFTQVLL